MSISPTQISSLILKYSQGLLCSHSQSAGWYPCSPQKHGYYFDVCVMGNQIQDTSEWQDLRHQQLHCSVESFLRKACSCFMWLIWIFVPTLVCPLLDRTNADALDTRSRTELFQSSESPGLISDLLVWHSGKEPTCQCRRRKRLRFNPRVRKILWMRVWQPTPVFLPGESHGQRSLAGYSP